MPAEHYELFLSIAGELHLAGTQHCRVSPRRFAKPLYSHPATHRSVPIASIICISIEPRVADTANYIQAERIQHGHGTTMPMVMS